MASTHQQTLIQSLEQLEGLGVVPQAAAALARGAGRASEALRKVIVEEIPAFSSSGDAEHLSDFERHARSHVEEIERLFGGGDVSHFEFVREHAQRRAEQRFPLEATLHAYRCGHKVLSRWLREAATEVTSANVERAVAAVADFAIEYTNVVSAICAAEYVARTRTLADSEGDRRTELLNILLGGYEDSDGRVARLLKRAGYLEQRLSFCVALVRSVDPLEMENPARVQRIVESIRQAVAPPTRILLGLRNNVVTAVFSHARRLSGWTAPRAQLAAQIHAALLVLGPSVLVGVSADQSSSAGIPRAAHEASVALDFASAGERVLRYSDLTIRRLLLHGAATALETTLPVWFAELAAADAKARGALIATLRALADCDLNVQQAARTLGVHPNTVYARMERISDLTGLDCRRYHDLSELLLAADCRQAVAG
jgi:PucR C-terminal helix-turn-helix domain/GGDEF-like domain